MLPTNLPSEARKVVVAEGALAIQHSTTFPTDRIQALGEAAAVEQTTCGVAQLRREIAIVVAGNGLQVGLVEFAILSTTACGVQQRTMMVENNAVDFIVCSFSDSVCVYKGQKEVETCEFMASGTVRNCVNPN